MVEQAKLLRFGDCCQMVEYWKQHADAAGCEDEAQRRHEARHATAATTFDEMVDLRAVLDPLGGKIVVAELNRLMEQQRRHDKHETGRCAPPASAAPTPWSRWPPVRARPNPAGSDRAR